MVAKKTKKPLKPDYVSLSEIFPWLKKETEDAYNYRMKLREKNQKKHPRLKVHAYGDKANFLPEQGFILYDPQFFIDVNEADLKQKKALKEWLTGQTCPLIPGVELACYPSDYGRFIEAFWEGRIATVND
jgi:hypothetical protein